MALRYDYRTGYYIGERYFVTEPAFVRRLRRLLLNGCEPNAALETLLEESTWQPGEKGVGLLSSNPSCRFCATPLLPPFRLYCSVVCEANESVAHAYARADDRLGD